MKKEILHNKIFLAQAFWGRRNGEEGFETGQNKILSFFFFCCCFL